MTEARFGVGQTQEQRAAGERDQAYEIKFDAEKGTLLLGLGGPEQIDADFAGKASEEGFSPKNELHMTVLGFKQGKLLGRLLKEKPELQPQVESIINNTQWQITPTGERYHVTKEYKGEEEPRESLIEMVDAQGLSGFIEQVNSLTGLQLEEQPPHVTLMTKGNPQGIGINSAQDLADLAPTRIA